ncbi:MAG: alpha-glucosidase/alpha-galactosidase [Saccharofermentanales bacterium]
MARITIIGAGSVVFTRTLGGDIMLSPELAGSVIALTDIDEGRLETARKMLERMASTLNSDVTVETYMDRRKALRGSKYVITTFQQGGLEAYRHDLEIPQKYGVDQAVGDTLGPGGVFRGLRTIPVMIDICRDMEKVCPDALLMNYVNPMAIITWAVNKATSIKMIGLCHSVQGTSEDIAGYCGVPYEEVSYTAAGINHMAWFLDLKWKGQDLYPKLREVMNDPGIYQKDMIKFEVLKTFKYFVTESSYHFSEYVPYYRRSQEMIEKIGKIDSWLKKWNGRCFDFASDRQDEYYDKLLRQIDGKEDMEIKRSNEYGCEIIKAMETGKAFRINGNVMNKGFITNLPNDCCVEVPCLVEKDVIRPCYVGDLPPQLAALDRSNINVQELAVKAALTGDREAAVMAITLDPLTAASISPVQIEKMVNEMFDAEIGYLPQFRR